MKRGFFSLPGLFLFIVVALIYIAMFPTIETLINIALPGSDFFTQVMISLIPTVILVGLLIGYYNSVVNPGRDYK